MSDEAKGDTQDAKASPASDSEPPDSQPPPYEYSVGMAPFEFDVTAEDLAWTPRLATLFGIDPEALPTTRAEWEICIHGEDLPTLRAALEAAGKSGAFRTEIRVVRPDRTERWLSGTGEIATAGGKVLRGFFVDVTGRREDERAAAEAVLSLTGRIKELEEAERRFSMLVDAVTDYAIFMLDVTGHVVNWNAGAERIKGYARDEIVGKHYSTFYTPEDRDKRVPWEAIERATSTGKYEAEGWRVRKDGSRFWANAVLNAIHDPTGRLVGFAKITRDLTERREAEARARQSQKMEAIGQLTGGVAHDFNNLLTIIKGNMDTLRRRLPSAWRDELARYIDSAMRGAERAALLTQRLLAFSRQQPLEPKSLSVNSLITGLVEMMRRTLGETIRVDTVLAADIWPVFVDGNQLESSLLNLAVNARDAMPAGGRLTIETANIMLDAAYATEAEIAPGAYVAISVSDSGAGMASDVLARAFDPFFTTKEIGQGTGLGLSQVYGFVKQSGGHVKIYSEVGTGTSVKLYLPRHGDVAAVPVVAPQQPLPAARGETILVVEDDPDVRTYAVEVLRDLGYGVIDAVDGVSALLQLAAHPEIRMLFTDVGLPGGMNGRQLADEALARRPDLKVLFTSGYARSAIVHNGRLDADAELLVKPFTVAKLAQKLRRVLDGG